MKRMKSAVGKKGTSVIICVVMAFAGLAIGFWVSYVAFKPNVAYSLPPIPKAEEGRVPCVFSHIMLERFERVICKSMIVRKALKEELIPPYAALDERDVLGKLPIEPILGREPVSLRRLMEVDEAKSLWGDKQPVKLWVKAPGFSRKGASWGYPIELLSETHCDVIGTLEGKSKIVANCCAIERVNSVGKSGRLKISLLVNSKEKKELELLVQADVKLDLVLRSYKDFK